MTGWRVFDADPATCRWAEAAHAAALRIAADPKIRLANLRHGQTWFVGVDALPNSIDGSVAGVPFHGAWRSAIPAPDVWHRAQLSIIYPGYPKRDPDESAPNHRFRLQRHAAHVDGLLPEGPQRRRYLREPHGFILGFPLTQTRAAPLMVWPGSHRLIGAALRRRIGKHRAKDVDLTEVYHWARSEVFDTIVPQPVHAGPGQAILLHRHLLHGVAPWEKSDTAPPEGRIIAYFRPQIDAGQWLAEEP